MTITETSFSSSRHGEDDRPASAARLAAEAYFSSPPSTAEHAAVEVPVLRRVTRVVLLPVPGVPAIQGQDASRRGRIVHRLPTGSVDAREAAPMRAQPSPQLDSATANAELDPGSPPPLQQVRKRRRGLHGDVTITRPAEEALRASSAAGAGDPSETEPVRSTPTRRMPTQSERADDLGPSLGDFPRYLKLRAQIAALEGLAQRAKRREAVQAVLWIKRAIRMHGISAEDLEL